jgi:CheY-like chemotaxis protein
MQRNAILIVEDDEDDVELMTVMLRRAKILNPIRTVSNKNDATSYLKGEGTYADRERFPVPVLVFVDLHLGMDSGFDILDWIKANKQDPIYGVVVLSGSDMNAANKAYRHGADSFLTKPLQFEDLQLLISRLRGVSLIETAAGREIRFGEG